MMTLILFGLFFVLVFLNVPIAISLGLAASVGLMYGQFPLSVIPGILYSGTAKFTLLAIPFFILAGSIMEYAGISKRLISFANACVGHRKGGLMAVVVIVACFFAAISGSGPATVAAIGPVLIPAMVKAGYGKDMPAALVSASGAIGIIIPPSIAYVVYASCTDVSVGALFTAGIIPGIVVGIAYYMAAAWDSRNNKEIIAQPKMSGKDRLIAFKDAFWGLMTPVIILGGIYAGIFTPTEAAGIAVIYGLIVGIFIYREIKLKDLYHIFMESAVSSATVMFIIAAAAVFAWILTTSQIASQLSQMVLAVSDNKYIILLLINIIFLIAGCFLDANSAFYILLPIIVPVLNAIDVSLLHAGVFLTVNMAIGMITPPVGINLYVGCNVAEIPVADICRKIIPFLIAGIVALFILTFIPDISLFLPRMIGQIK
ncbi:TRAP transporter large permease [Anaerotignum propionicum]|jgi:C4-dicarboxylate transporter DctM subunit|uniref:C4-dicarboxylate transporter, DctM subunit n=3 Tax=Anaerotignum propionicum TaxID=28446 RepID=A0A0X8VBJ9_ANAPI|nr:TRAP transporter large permease [Anaerotignum propionicum]AMJ41908.1 sialic acid TRAP transporter permease protein SiaT [Anaerotignum propionicum DSM 1682]SHE95220.1 C4-dicarboxylate transporter, DctM subunit [[Clostridium] propionicum DSM 1682] [Anaerotignum propionicum DSM 1682]